MNAHARIEGTADIRLLPEVASAIPSATEAGVRLAALREIEIDYDDGIA